MSRTAKNKAKGKRSEYILFAISILLFTGLSASFSLMPIDGKEAVNGISVYTFAAGIMFWSCLVGTAIVQCVLSHKRKAWYAENRIRRSRVKRRPGIISFFENPGAVCADIAAVLNLAGFVAALILTKGTGYICYILLSLFVLSFCMHCTLNGKIFYYITNKEKIFGEMKKERAKSSETKGEDRK